jgi:hypothetical protein
VTLSVRPFVVGQDKEAEGSQNRDPIPRDLGSALTVPAFNPSVRGQLQTRFRALNVGVRRRPLAAPEGKALVTSQTGFYEREASMILPVG